MIMKLSGDEWEVIGDAGDNVITFALEDNVSVGKRISYNTLTIAEARELAIAIDKVIEHVEGQANAE